MQKQPRYASQWKHYLDALLKNSQGKLCRFTHFSVKFIGKFAARKRMIVKNRSNLL